MFEFSFPYRLKAGQQIEVLAVIRGDNLHLGFTLDATDSPALISGAALEYYAIADYAWELHQERVREERGCAAV